MSYEREAIVFCDLFQAKQMPSDFYWVKQDF